MSGGGGHHRPSQIPAARRSPTEANIDDSLNDDTDIPLSEVIKDTVGLTLGPEVNGNHTFLVENVMKDAEDELVPMAEEENMWAYNKMGEKWSDIPAGEIELGTSGDD